MALCSSFYSYHIYEIDLVSYLAIIVGVCQLVKVKKSLVDVFLQCQGGLHCLHPSAPLITLGSL